MEIAGKCGAFVWVSGLKCLGRPHHSLIHGEKLSEIACFYSGIQN